MTATQLTEKPAQQIASVLLSADFRVKVAHSMGVGANDPVIDRFARVAMHAVQQDPKLLNADRNSLYLACQAAAVDGLMPDGREGKLVVYSSKQGNGWVDKVQWQRMIGGLRKLSVRHDFDLIAKPVYANDDFEYEEGSDPRISHKPTKLGKDKGDVIGYYAIATHLKTGRQYFEVMDKTQVDAIKDRTKSRDAQKNIVGPWKTDEVEMGRKTVAKRLFKSLPLYDADDLQAVIKRDNEEYTDTFMPSDPEPPTVVEVVSSERPSALQAVVDAEPEDTDPLPPELHF